jgi:hypothetical protein
MDMSNSMYDMSNSFTQQLNLQNQQKVLKLNCESNYIFIAWTHYGHQAASSSSDTKKQKPKTKLNNNNNNMTDENCYFSPKDCLVSVDYVANECNGLTSCQISLDAQYLHSCKAYSDYLFIIYECVEAKQTINICDSISTNFNQSTTFYLQSPSYPNEYMNYLDCNCSMRSMAANKGGSSESLSSMTTIQIEQLEFDLESSSSSSSSDLKQIGLESSLSRPNNKNSFVKYSLTSQNVCNKDYFSINSDIQICGTQSTFSGLISVPPSSQQYLLKSKYQVTNFRFKSDDALTRRGFWTKIRVSPLNAKDCPENFLLINNICIRIFNEQLTWYEAHSYCSSMGYSLALIDNFELEKQLNQALFYEEDDALIIVSNGKNSDLNNKASANSNKKFWIGMRHLNHTNWFDTKNEIIRFRQDEENWWPWLIVDSTSYNKGSCVAKKRNSLIIEDCYKRMPFACQYKIPISKLEKKTQVQLRCGANSNIFDTDFEPTTTRISSSTANSPTKTAGGPKSNKEQIKILSVFNENQKNINNNKAPQNLIPSLNVPVINAQTEPSAVDLADLNNNEVNTLPVKNLIIDSKNTDSSKYKKIFFHLCF